VADSTNGNEGKKEGRRSAYTISGEPGSPAADEQAAAGAEAGDAPPTGAASENLIGETLRESFRDFVLKNVVPEGQKGRVDVNLDADFLRKHGTQLIASLMEGVAKAILPDAVNVPLAAKADKPKTEPAAEAASAPAAEGAEGAEGDVDIAVKFDAMSFLKTLLAPAASAVAQAAASASAAIAAPQVEAQGKDEGEPDNDDDELDD
jgi:hypothetical protein